MATEIPRTNLKTSQKASLKCLLDGFFSSDGSDC